MSELNKVRVHWGFWLIAVLVLLWNIMGALNYFMQMNPESVASFPESHRAIIEGRPNWATAGFAVAVFGGLLGAALLLFRRFSAFYLFVLSLLGTIVTMVHTMSVIGESDKFQVSDLAIMVVMPIILAVVMVWYPTMAKKRGWLS
jgi:hypothetical protein